MWACLEGRAVSVERFPLWQTPTAEPERLAVSTYTCVDACIAG